MNLVGVTFPLCTSNCAFFSLNHTHSYFKFIKTEQNLEITLEKLDILISSFQECLRKVLVISSDAELALRILVYYEDEDGDRIIIPDNKKLRFEIFHHQVL